MRTTSSPKFVARSRAPRVAIEYDVELYGAQRRAQLPFVIGVLADLSGHPAEPLPPLAERKFTAFDADNLDTRLAVSRPRLDLQVPDADGSGRTRRVELAFECMADFDAGAVARRLPELGDALERRRHMADLVRYLDGKSDAEALLLQMLRDPAALRALADGALPTDRLRDAFRPRSAQAAQALERAVRVLAQEALACGDMPHDDAVDAIDHLLAGLDARLSAQLRPILQHPEFQRLEGAWRGLQYLVGNSETNESLKVRVLDVSKAELGRMLRRHKGAGWDQSPLFKRLVEDEFGSFGGEPYGCLVGDYLFDHSIADIEVLGELAKICAAAHAPLIAGAALSFANAEPAVRGDAALGRTVVGHLVTPEFAAWRSLQHADESRYVVLALPRFLARLPWGGRARPLDDFAFEELTPDPGPEQFVWCNAAYAMAVCISRAHTLYGWCARIRGVESGGAVEGLPVHRWITATGERCAVGPVEVAINDRQEAELARAGFLVLLHRRDTDYAAFGSAPTIHQHGFSGDPATQATAHAAASLPYVLVCARFVQSLKCMVRDKLGSLHDREAMQRWLQGWIRGYVTEDAATVSDEARARRPLASADLDIVDVEGNPGYYTLRLYLRPAYQLDALPVSIRIVSRLPSGKSAA